MHPERICWGYDKFCPAGDLACGNGTIRTPHPEELFGEDWDEWAGSLNVRPEGIAWLVGEPLVVGGRFDPQNLARGIIKFQQRRRRLRLSAANIGHESSSGDQATSFGCLEAHLLEGIHPCARIRLQTLDSKDRPDDHPGQGTAIVGCAPFPEAGLCLFWRKPGGPAVGFLRHLEAQDLAEMGMGQGWRRVTPLPESVGGEASFLDAPVDPGLFEGFETCGLRVG